MIEPLRISFEVGCGQRHAFDVWTNRIDLWWPADHTATGADGLLITLEPRVGGRIFQRDPTGVEIDWGEVTDFAPPDLLAYRWHLRRDRADATDVRIRFVPMDPDRTRVDIEHHGWERLGADGAVWRERNQQGWRTLLPHFVAAATALD
jgi:uncharacterized protein YndB with AHSA1/START domain